MRSRTGEGSRPKARPSAEPGESLQRLGVVRVALQRAAEHRVVQGERDAQHRRTRRPAPARAATPSRQPWDAPVSSREYAPPARSAAASAGREQHAGPAVADGLGRAHRHHEVGLDEAAVDAQGHVPGRPDLDEVVGLDVVHLHAAAEAPREIGRDEQLQPVAARSRREPGGDEQGLALGRDPARDERLDRRLEGCAPRIAEHAGKRERGRLDHHGRPSAAGRRLFERRARQREAERIAHGRADVVDRGGRRRRAEDDGALRCVEVLDAGAREQGDAGQRNAIAYDRA